MNLEKLDLRQNLLAELPGWASPLRECGCVVLIEPNGTKGAYYNRTAVLHFLWGQQRRSVRLSREIDEKARRVAALKGLSLSEVHRARWSSTATRSSVPLGRAATRT